ncbi:unnamed protein product [Rotaria sp. Silwood1]|nr:unnamed protein product [Rotaria sp. Silwood1]CAF1594210.1 unnamed protein product [Rotaria sp. Silwood1]CAF3665783.1 unnamed protein product [Rotaria sp. Silwood1]CAF3676482.1 unnamed protein product [Rotaria sp. Silwood1]CAF4581527.1 unnamed protein product [Rotaria sp. Silwood1]
MILWFRLLIIIGIILILIDSKWINHQEGEGDDDGRGSRVDRAAAVVEVLGGFGDRGKINGVPIAPIVGGAVGGGITLAIIVGCCVIFFTCFLPWMKGRPLCCPKFYIHGAIPIGSDISDLIFISGTFASYHYISDEYYGPYDMILGFYPEAGYIVYGKGKDNVGTYVIKGIYSSKTLRMSLKKHYQLGTGNSEENLGHKATVQVKWDRINQQFEGKYYVRNKLHHYENKYVIRYEGA